MENNLNYIGFSALGAGIAVLGAGFGIGKIGGCLLYTSRCV